MTKVFREFPKFFLVILLFGPFFVSKDPNAIDLAVRLQGPSMSAPLGKDHQGADLFAKLLKGSQTSLFVGLSVVTSASLIGLLIGGWSGFRGGLIDTIFMSLTEILLSLPGVLLSMVLTLLIEPSVLNLCFALMMTAWITNARIVRSEVLRLKSMEFVEAARALGASETRVLTRHLLPSVVPLLLVSALSQLPSVILSEASLSYLGLGLPLDQPSLGQMIAQGRKYYIEAPYQTLIPGLMVLVIVLSLQSLGNRDHLGK
ncbi:MAG: ABC transporter permease [Bdellovibrionales bacterium]|nr:ABC transporter permease [Bdellovibrionales bacterium]